MADQDNHASWVASRSSRGSNYSIPSSSPEETTLVRDITGDEAPRHSVNPDYIRFQVGDDELNTPEIHRALQNCGEHKTGDFPWCSTLCYGKSWNIFTDDEGRPQRFLDPETLMPLRAAKYSCGPCRQIIIVQQVEGTDFRDGHPVAVRNGGVTPRNCRWNGRNVPAVRYSVHKLSHHQPKSKTGQVLIQIDKTRARQDSKSTRHEPKTDVPSGKDSVNSPRRRMVSIDEQQEMLWRSPYLSNPNPFALSVDRQTEALVSESSSPQLGARTWPPIQSSRFNTNLVSTSGTVNNSLSKELGDQSTELRHFNACFSQARNDPSRSGTESSDEAVNASTSSDDQSEVLSKARHRSKRPRTESPNHRVNEKEIADLLETKYRVSKSKARNRHIVYPDGSQSREPWQPDRHPHPTTKQPYPGFANLENKDTDLSRTSDALNIAQIQKTADQDVVFVFMETLHDNQPYAQVCSKGVSLRTLQRIANSRKGPATRESLYLQFQGDDDQEALSEMTESAFQDIMTAIRSDLRKTSPKVLVVNNP